MRVEFFAEQIRWRFRTPQDTEWQSGEPTAENWAELENSNIGIISSPLTTISISLEPIWLTMVTEVMGANPTSIIWAWGS